MIIGILIVLGLCFGSFVNALVWRIHQQSLPKSKRPKKVDLSIQKGRSVCPNCHHILSWVDLLPVISWIGLRGKCRYCAKPISWQYPLVELLTALIFVISYWFWPFEFTSSEVVIFGLWLAIVVNLIALAVYDIKWMLLPNRLVKFALGFAVVLSWITISARSGEIYVDLAKLFIAILISGGLFAVLFYVSSGKWIGGGDVKLGFVLGIVVATPVNACMMLFIASLLGCLIALPSIALSSKSMQTKIPFGPFLIISTFIVYLFGTDVAEAYLRLLGIS